MTGCSSVGEQHTSVGRACLRSTGLLTFSGGKPQVDSHPDNYTMKIFDWITLFQHFKCTYVDSIDMDRADNSKHGNIPYLILLFKYLEQWKGAHDGQFPSNYHEKKAFKKLIRQGIRANNEGVSLEKDNFDEAIASVNSSLVLSSIPAEVRKVFEDQCCTCINSTFWLLVRALKKFVASEAKGLLPLRGTIPDMTSSSDMYIPLQWIY